jgi:hypothetical protein
MECDAREPLPLGDSSKFSKSIHLRQEGGNCNVAIRLSDCAAKDKNLLLWTFELPGAKSIGAISSRIARKRCRSCGFCGRLHRASFYQLELEAEGLRRRAESGQWRPRGRLQNHPAAGYGIALRLRTAECLFLIPFGVRPESGFVFQPQLLPAGNRRA